MAKKALIRLKSEPKKPKRRKISEKKYIGYFDNLKELLDTVGGTNPRHVNFEHDWDQIYVLWSRDQTEEEFAFEMEHYLKKKKEYDKWYAENEELIIKEKARRAEIEKAKAAKEIIRIKNEEDKKKKKLESKIKRLEKELKELQ